jgi:cytochrome b6-f complex iron-sulfur subunit
VWRTLSRRTLLRGALRSSLRGGVGITIAWFAAACGSSGAGGFGGVIGVGRLQDLLGQVDSERQPAYVPEARAYVNRYPASALPAARSTASYRQVLPGMEEGLVALYQKCTHLGCRVPWCTSSQWFECPCHGSKYNRVGEQRHGPAPRGLDRFPVRIDNGEVVIDTRHVVVGPPIGTDTTGQSPEGPFCAG